MKIRRQKNLESKIWDKNQNIKYYVANILLSFTWNFIDFVRNEYQADINNKDIQDIILYGSITNYFYNKKSDINIGIVLNKNIYIPSNTKKYKFINRDVSVVFFNQENKINQTRYCSGPIFSLLKNEWIYKPVIIPKAQFRYIKAQSKLMFKRMLNDYNVVKKAKFEISLVRELYNNLITSRNMNLLENPEQNITSVHLAFNEMKYSGLIDKLKNKINDYAQQGAK